MGSRYVKRGERKTVYEDMNILYGWSMSQYLPTGDFREIKVTRSSLKTYFRAPNIDERGLLIECDLEYPSGIHEKTKFITNLKDKKTVKAEVFSSYRMKNKPEKNESTEEPNMDQTYKQKIFLQYRVLKFYIRHGFRFVKIYTVYKYKQSLSLAKYNK